MTSEVVISEAEVNALLQDSVGRKVLQETLVGLAQGKLRTSMGSAYANIVVKCLQAVKGGFKDSSGTEPFEFLVPDREATACLLLEKSVVVPLRRVNLGV